MKKLPLTYKIMAGVAGVLVIAGGVYAYRTHTWSRKIATNPTQQQASSYAHLVYLNRRPMNGWNTPEKMQCGTWKLQRETSQKDGTESLVLSPGNVVLAGATTDVTFDQDCEHVYWIQEQTTLHKYTIKTKKKEVVMIPRGLFKDHTLVIGKKVYYPSPTFVYAYGSDKSPGEPLSGSRLLVSFQTPTTGKDGSSNFSIQAVYEAKKWKLITKGGGLEPVILDTEGAVLSFPDVDPKNAGVAPRRHDIYLVKIEDGYIGLARPFDYRMVCMYGGDDQDPDYQACRQKELDALFTPGHPELNAP